MVPTLLLSDHALPGQPQLIPPALLGTWPRHHEEIPQTEELQRQGAECLTWLRLPGLTTRPERLSASGVLRPFLSPPPGLPAIGRGMGHLFPDPRM